MAPKRPTSLRRKNKSDRLIHPDATANEIRCDMMLAPFDKACADMEAKWGIDRLPELVSVETAEKWGSAMAKLNAAIMAGDIEETKSRVGVCVRGLAALDAEATAAGHKPKRPDVWEAEYNGRVFSVIQDVKDWINADVPEGRRIYTMREVAVALDAMDRGLFSAIKDAIPGAQVVAVRNEEPAPYYNDDLPF